MNLAKSVFCWTILSFFICAEIYSQENRGQFSGRVVDSAKIPIRLATVGIYRQDSIIKQTLTDSAGSYTLTADTGIYWLKVSSAGLVSISRRVVIKSKATVLDDVILHADVRSLQAVTVKTRKQLIEQSDDKVSYIAENDPAAKTESASDLLRKTPLVTVDGDGNVQVNGQSNFKILLNGRETSMFAANTKEALKNFPGAVISRIDVITSPSARYDAEGTGGVINIVTRKKVVGYNASFSSYYSTLTRYTQSASLNMKVGKVGVSAYASTGGSFRNIQSQSFSETSPFGNALFLKRTLNGDKESRNTSSDANLELAYDIDSLNTITAYGNIGKYRNNSILAQTILTEFLSQAAQQSFFNQNNHSTNPNEETGADFIRRFRNKPEKELSFRFNSEVSRSNSFLNSHQAGPAQNRFVANTSLTKTKIQTFQIDLMQPLKGKQKLETGIKAILRSASSNYQSLLKYAGAETYKPNPSNSDQFRYKQDVYSLYASYQVRFKKTSLRTGLRAEQTIVDGEFTSSKTTVHQQYLNLVPNFLLSRKFSSAYTFSVAYNLRLHRPSISNLNPFVNNNDSLNISFGNPALEPQTLHTVSLQNRIAVGGFFLSLSFNGSYSDNLIVQFADFNNVTGVTRITNANVGKENQASVGLTVNAPISEKFNFNLNTQLRYNKIENTSNLLQRREGFSGSAAGNFHYKLVGKFTISGSGGVSKSPYAFVNSPSLQGFYQVNFGQKLFAEKLALTVNVNNFHQAFLQFRTVTENSNFRATTINSNPYRVIYFGATYNFGKLKEEVSKKKGVSNDDTIQ